MQTKKSRVIIVGAGIAGKELLQEINKHFKDRYNVMGFVDDDPDKINSYLLGVKVFGKIRNLRKLIKTRKIDEVLIAIPSADGETIRKIIDECFKTTASFRIVPRHLEIVQGKVKIQQVRKLSIEDMLGRAIVQSEQREFIDYFKNKTILVTGAAGSIGSEICKQLTQFKPKLIVAVDWWESGLFNLGIELSNLISSKKFKVVVANIREEKRIDSIFKTFNPQFIFHAAAFKHVPLMQDFPTEAVKNNVVGTDILARVANKYKVRKFINISTDKAVDPTSIMGVTKLIAENIVSAYNEKSNSSFSSVRFGNVLNSQGSVIPLFEKQIALGGPVTVTDKKMTRYFMTIPEAVQLVLHASIMGEGDDIFLLDMGEPIKILALAEMMIRLSGFIPHEDIKIKYVGIRPGEKLNEELSLADENLENTKNERIFRIKQIRIKRNKVKEIVSLLKKAADANDSLKVYRLLKKVAPNLQKLSL